MQTALYFNQKRFSAKEFLKEKEILPLSEGVQKFYSAHVPK